MNYVMNDYSLRAQFMDVETFYDSLRNYTMPVLKRIQKENGAVIWKNETFWQQEICPGIALQDLQPRRNERTNERSAEITWLKSQLRRLCREEPHWSESEDVNVLATRYCFDQEMADSFPVLNCFIKAYMIGGRMISFEHEKYLQSRLEFYMEEDSKEVCCGLDNIYDDSWWQEETEIVKWPRIKNLYRVQVRAREVDRHEPHFHVEYNEYSASFAISDGRVLEGGKEPMPGDMLREIREWYEEHVKSLENAWNKLHKPMFGQKNQNINAK